jgi:hypothetical protein
MVAFPTCFQCRYVSKYAYTEASVYVANIATELHLLGKVPVGLDNMATSYNKNTVTSASY